MEAVRQVEGIGKIDIKAWFAKWFIPAVILETALYTALNYSMKRFIIESDSLREFNTYLYYVKQGYWSPISDNLLSSSLWTTYLPALVQRLIGFENPEIIYRVVLAVVTVPLPLAVYLLTQRYTSRVIAVGMAMIFYLTFYFQGFASYARIHIAITMAICLLMAIMSHSRWQYLFISLAVIGLVFAHYTTAYIYAGVLTIASVVAIVRYFVWHKRFEHDKALVIGAVLLSLAAIGFYSFVVPTPGHYASGLVKDVVSEVISFSTNLNIFAGQSADFVLAKGFLVTRVLIATVIFLALWKQGQLFTLVSVLYALGIGVAIFSLWSPVVGASIGVFRPSYILLPVELLGIAYWWGRRGKDWRLFVPLVILSPIYH